MLVDLNNLYWVGNEGDDWFMGLIGGSIQVEVRKTESISDLSFIDGHENIIKDFGYVAYFNGVGVPYNELIDSKLYGEFHTPVMYPLIGQNISVDTLKDMCVDYLEKLYLADEPSRVDVGNLMAAEEDSLRKLVYKFMEMTGYDRTIVN